MPAECSCVTLKILNANLTRYVKTVNLMAHGAAAAAHGTKVDMKLVPCSRSSYNNNFE